MYDQATQRLAELRTEFETGQRKLQELEAQATNLRATMLRISGAIQVLEELLADNSALSESAAPDMPVNGKEQA